ncbi:MAG TPA: hypothetical protein VNG13_13835 [Mycobacteriales bacterium]|nr:hypothetical protein [Mycobacteriales bacterium]
MTESGLSESVARIMREQHGLRADLDRLTGWGEAHPDVFAGVWFDNAAAEAGTGPVRIGVGVVGDPAAFRAALEPTLEHPNLLMLVAKRYPLEELNALSGRIVETFMGGSRLAGEPYVSQVGAKVHLNRVTVSISQDDPAALALASQIEARFGPDMIQISLGHVEPPEPPVPPRPPGVDNDWFSGETLIGLPVEAARERAAEAGCSLRVRTAGPVHADLVRNRIDAWLVDKKIAAVRRPGPRPSGPARA